MRGLMTIFFLSFPLSALSAEFEIFAFSKTLIDESKATVYYIDKGDQLIESINKVMRAQGVMNEDEGKRFATPELSQALVNQVKGLLKASRYRLKYFPAIVVDGQYVIYGTTDIGVYQELKP